MQVAIASEPIRFMRPSPNCLPPARPPAFAGPLAPSCSCRSELYSHALRVETVRSKTKNYIVYIKCTLNIYKQASEREHARRVCNNASNIHSC